MSLLNRLGICPATLALFAMFGVLALDASQPVSAKRPPFVAHLKAPTHHPKAEKPWRITITARSHSGKKLSGRVQYEFLHGGQVVSRQSNYTFKNGVFHDTLTWPKRSIGIKLTFRAVVTTKPGVVRLSYDVRVRR